MKRADDRAMDHSPPNGNDFGLRSGNIHLRDYLRVLHKHRWPTATALTLIMGLSLLYNLTRVPTYEARVQLLIDSSTENVVNFKEVVEQDKALSAYYQTQILLLRSRGLARRTIEALHGWSDPELAGGPPGSWIVRFADAVFSPVAALQGVNASLRPPTTAGSASQRGDDSHVVDAFLGRLKVAPVGESRLVEARFVARDPAFAANAVNALAEQYIQQNRDMKFEASREALDWLREKLRGQQKEVEDSELAAQRYRERHDPLSSDDKQSIVMQRLADLSAAVTRVKTERIAKEAQYRQLEQIRATNSDLRQLPAVMANPLVQELEKELADLRSQKAQLGERFGAKHPQIVKLIAGIDITEARLAAEMHKIVGALRNELEASTAQEQRLAAALEAQKQEALNLNRMAIGYGTLERDASSSRQVFDNLIQRLKEAGIVGGLKTSDIRIVDRAERPRQPVTRTRTNLLLSFLFGTMVSIGLAFFLEYVDTTVKSPEEVRSHLRLPFLGMLPTCSPGAKEDLPILSRVRSTHFLEAFQAVRTNVLFSTASSEAPKTLIVTSTQPTEGKTVVAANLAISFGQIGMRVLLVDGDMRRPSLHTTFRHERTPGLSGVLAGEYSASAAVRQTTEPNVFLLTAGGAPSNPAALLESARFRDLLKEVGANYDWVIVDAPPVLPVTDASIVAAHVSGVLFVVGSEMTSRFAAMNALHQLEQARAGFVGAVLNRVNVVRDAYYYSNYYDRRHASYYSRQRAS